jgi:hypothetical protein
LRDCAIGQLFQRLHQYTGASQTQIAIACGTTQSNVNGDGQNQVLLCLWLRHGILAGLTAGSSSSELRMIFIPSPRTCRLLSKEVLTAACGFPSTSPPWGAGQAGAKV